jgi:hypothetical protein
MANTWTEQQARKELDAWRSSGQSIDRYARERDVAAHRLRYWRMRLEQSTVTKSKGVSLLPVRVLQASSGPIDVILAGGCVARVSRGFDEETLARVIAVVGRR